MNKWLPASIGAEPKKLAILGGLVVVLGAVYWINLTADAPAATPMPARTPTVVAKAGAPRGLVERALVPARRGAASSGVRTIQDFRPTLKLPEGADVSRIDPALRLDLLAQAREGEESRGGRSLFEFSQPPAPPAPPPPKVKDIVVTELVKAEPPKPVSTEPPKPPPAPPPPPIPLKYYGYAGSSQGVQRRAFFLDGEYIFVAGENELVRNRYRIVRIGVNSAVVEDTTNKSQQTLPLVEEVGA